MAFDIVLFTDLTGQFFHNKPAGPYSLASTLRRAGFSVMVVDHFQRYLRWPDRAQEMLAKVIGPSTLFAGFSSTFLTTNIQEDKPFVSYREFNSGQHTSWPDFEQSKKFVETIRAINPNTKIVYGGINAVNPQAVLSGIAIDYVIHGYAEVSAVKLAQHLKHGADMRVRPWHNTLLLDYDKEALEWQFSTHQTRYELHDLVLPGETLSTETSRGCMYNCHFCDFPLRGRKRGDLSYHMQDNLLRDYLIRNYQQFQVVNYMITDDTFNETTDRVRRFRDVVLSTGLPLKFMVFLRQDLLMKNPEQLELLQQAGVISAWIGLESFNQTSSSSITKSYDVEAVKQSLFDTRRRAGEDFKIFGSFMFGLPGDTAKSINRWMQWVVDESPLDCIQPEAFFIRTTNTWTSKIATNLEDFGYTMPTWPIWQTKEMNYKMANLLAEHWQQKLWDTGRNKLAAFHLLGMMGMGYDFDSIKNIPINQLPFDEIKGRIQSQFDQYHTALINLDV